MVPWEEYEALRQQHVEGMQALQDMAGILQGMMLGGTLLDTLKKFMLKSMPLPEPQPDVDLIPTKRPLLILIPGPLLARIEGQDYHHRKGIFTLHPEGMKNPERRIGLKAHK